MVTQGGSVGRSAGRPVGRPVGENNAHYSLPTGSPFRLSVAKSNGQLRFHGSRLGQKPYIIVNLYVYT